MRINQFSGFYLDCVVRVEEGLHTPQVGMAAVALQALCAETTAAAPVRARAS